MKSWVLVPLLIFFLSACKGKNRVPSGVLSQKKMQAVLWDVMRADEFLSANVLRKDSSLDKITESFKYYQQIFAIHKTTKEQFEKSFSFYKDHPDLFKAIMDSLSRAPVAAPTQLVQPVAAPEITQPVQKQSLPDSGIKLQKKKPLSVE
ncbi:MAG: DUF4296 domain-containing protein [Chitinophagaceae bacterium]|nr:DUF4296 domain-containing protein [Chitinophagaceae bacterium]